MRMFLKYTAILVFLVFSSNLLRAQTDLDSITVIQSSGGYQLNDGDRQLTKKELVSMLKTNDQAYRQFKSAQSTNAFGIVIGALGGGLVGWPIGTALAGGEPSWMMLGIGAGLIIVSIPISQSAIRKKIEAVETYNRGLRTTTFWDRSELKFAATGNGVGLTLVF